LNENNKMMMNAMKYSMMCGAAILLGTSTPGIAQSSSLELHLYAGVNITGTVGEIYVVQSSSNPDQTNSWESLAFVQMPASNHLFVDTTVPAQGNRYFRTLVQSPPTNMAFIPPGTFTMGSPTNEVERNVNEGPQTRVQLSRGFWIGKYEVTQAEYLDVTGSNPSAFPGDLSRPVSSVSWPDATNYCWMLTQRELAAGHIPAGSQYRLPTEAEWECAARAGTSTRFSYGDDPGYASLPNYAWNWMNGALTVHPVGQKLPNAWGLYDIYGNVWEWCQDWLGELPGGTTVDPQGPPSNSIGWKVIRGGGYDYGEADCRSARRFFFGGHPALTDSNLGFRVVLSCR
jgi:formylglycine-generating enzyme required for sulfatase activity